MTDHWSCRMAHSAEAVFSDRHTVKPPSFLSLLNPIYTQRVNGEAQGTKVLRPMQRSVGTHEGLLSPPLLQPINPGSGLRSALHNAIVLVTKLILSLSER